MKKKIYKNLVKDLEHFKRNNMYNQIYKQKKETCEDKHTKYERQNSC